MEPEPHRLIMVGSNDTPIPWIREQTGINSATKWHQANRQVGTLRQQLLPVHSPGVCLCLFLSLKIRSSIFSLAGYRENDLGDEPSSGMLQSIDRRFFCIKPWKLLKVCPTEHVLDGDTFAYVYIGHL